MLSAKEAWRYGRNSFKSLSHSERLLKFQMNTFRVQRRFSLNFSLSSEASFTIIIFETLRIFLFNVGKKTPFSSPLGRGICVWIPEAILNAASGKSDLSVVYTVCTIDRLHHSIRQRSSFSCLLLVSFRRCRGSWRSRRCGTVRGCRKETEVRSSRRSFRCLRQLEPSGCGYRYRRPRRGRSRPIP